MAYGTVMLLLVVASILTITSSDVLRIGVDDERPLDVTTCGERASKHPVSPHRSGPRSVADQVAYIAKLRATPKAVEKTEGDPLPVTVIQTVSAHDNQNVESPDIELFQTSGMAAESSVESTQFQHASSLGATTKGKQSHKLKGIFSGDMFDPACATVLLNWAGVEKYGCIKNFLMDPQNLLKCGMCKAYLFPFKSDIVKALKIVRRKVDEFNLPLSLQDTAAILCSTCGYPGKMIEDAIKSYLPPWPYLPKICLIPPPLLNDDTEELAKQMAEAEAKKKAKKEAENQAKLKTMLAEMAKKKDEKAKEQAELLKKLASMRQTKSTLNNGHVGNKFLSPHSPSLDARAKELDTSLTRSDGLPQKTEKDKLSVEVANTERQKAVMKILQSQVQDINRALNIGGPEDQGRSLPSPNIDQLRETASLRQNQARQTISSMETSTAPAQSLVTPLSAQQVEQAFMRQLKGRIVQGQEEMANLIRSLSEVVADMPPIRQNYHILALSSSLSKLPQAQLKGVVSQLLVSVSSIETQSRDYALLNLESMMRGAGVDTEEITMDVNSFLSLVPPSRRGQSLGLVSPLMTKETPKSRPPLLKSINSLLSVTPPDAVDHILSSISTLSIDQKIEEELTKLLEMVPNLPTETKTTVVSLLGNAWPGMSENDAAELLDIISATVKDGRSTVPVAAQFPMVSNAKVSSADEPSTSSASRTTSSASTSKESEGLLVPRSVPTSSQDFSPSAGVQPSRVDRYDQSSKKRTFSPNCPKRTLCTAEEVVCTPATAQPPKSPNCQNPFPRRPLPGREVILSELDGNIQSLESMVVKGN